MHSTDTAHAAAAKKANYEGSNIFGGPVEQSPAGTANVVNGMSQNALAAVQLSEIYQ